ncbi:MAG: uridine kinase, partial [Proteobacteria bacterium]|nr:uridine kinase [Pseudomonadota bacterium]
VQKLRSRLDGEHPLVINIDHYYRDLSQIPLHERAKVNFDDPDSIEHELLHKHIIQLQSGLAIDRPCYDFASHTRRQESERLEPSRVIILDGIFALCFPELLKLFDLKLFLDVQDDVRVVRRIGRDMAERGRSYENCADQYLGSVKSSHSKFIKPSRSHADFVIPWHHYNERALVFMANLIKAEVQVKADRGTI